MQYVNLEKFNRAKLFAKANGKEDDEAAIAERYVAIGGKVVGDDAVDAVTEVTAETPEVKLLNKVSTRSKRADLEAIAKAEGASDEEVAGCANVASLVTLINSRRAA